MTIKIKILYKLFICVYKTLKNCDPHTLDIDLCIMVCLKLFAILYSLFAGCYKITTVFSHAQTVVLCVGCSTVLCQPTGGKARLTEGITSAQTPPKA